MHNFSAPQKSRPRPRLPSQIAPPRLFISSALARPPNCITPCRRNHLECGCPRKEHARSRRTTNSRKVDYTTPSNYSMSHTRNIPEIKKIYTVYSCLFWKLRFFFQFNLKHIWQNRGDISGGAVHVRHAFQAKTASGNHCKTVFYFCSNIAQL